MRLTYYRSLIALSFNYFAAKDVVRHPVVQKIVIAYEAFEAAAAAKKQAEREAEQAARLAATIPVSTPAVLSGETTAKSRSRQKKIINSPDTETP